LFFFYPFDSFTRKGGAMGLFDRRQEPDRAEVRREARKFQAEAAARNREERMRVEEDRRERDRFERERRQRMDDQGRR